jgi:hypothetical protein
MTANLMTLMIPTGKIKRSRERLSLPILNNWATSRASSGVATGLSSAEESSEAGSSLVASRVLAHYAIRAFSQKQAGLGPSHQAPSGVALLNVAVQFPKSMTSQRMNRLRCAAWVANFAQGKGEEGQARARAVYR